MPVQNYQHKHKQQLRPREETARVTGEIVLWAWWCLGTTYKSDYGRFSLVKCIKHLLGPWVHTSLISAGIFMKKLQYRWEFEVIFISSMLFQKNTTVTWAKRDQGSPADIILVNIMCYLIWQAERKGSVIKVVVNRKQNLLIFLQRYPEWTQNFFQSWLDLEAKKLQNNSLLEENECPGALSQAPVSEEDDVPQVDCIYFLESLFGQDANHKAGAVVLNLEWFLCLNWALGLLGHAAWFQESALPTSSLVLTPGSASPAGRWATGSDSSGPCLWPPVCQH